MKVLTLILITLLCCSRAFCQARKNADAVICWKEEYRLRWSDFLASAKPLPDTNNYIIASISPDVKIKGVIEEDSTHNFIVTVSLNKKRAWVRDSSIAGTAVLNHEQFHFNIAELVGRKIRLRIVQARMKGIDVFNAEFGSELKSLLNEHILTNRLYDEQTAHGVLTEKQHEWETYVINELYKLKDYKSTADTCVP